MSEDQGRARVHVWISGRVQGVGFRFAICDLAEGRGLGGWVRNLSDGRVEAVFEGPAAEVAQAVAWCREGPPGAWVSDVKTESETPFGDISFHARRSSYQDDSA